MPEQRRIGFRWHLRQVMAAHNLWKSVNGGRELTPLRRVGSTRGQFSDDADRQQQMTNLRRITWRLVP